MKRSSQTCRTRTGKDAQGQYHGPTGRGQREQQGKWEPRYADTGEQRELEQQDACSAEHTETADAAITHDLQFAFARAAAEEPIAGIHESIEMQSPRDNDHHDNEQSR